MCFQAAGKSIVLIGEIYLQKGGDRAEDEERGPFMCKLWLVGAYLYCELISSVAGNKIPITYGVFVLLPDCARVFIREDFPFV